MRGGGPRRYEAAVPGLAAATVLAALCGLTTAIGGGATAAATWVSDLAAIALAACGGLGCLRAAVRTGGTTRRGWAAMTVGCWCWSIGQLLTTVLESVPCPPGSPQAAADIAFLCFPVAALAALHWLAPATSALAGSRRVLDALAVGCVVGLVLWTTALDGVVPPSASSPTAAGWLGRPVGAVVLLTLTVLTLVQTRTLSLRWALLGSAMVAMAVSDAAVTFRIATGGHPGATVEDWGWWAAFCLLGTVGAAVGPAGGTGREARREQPSSGASLLPYLPLAAAGAMVIMQYLRGGGLDGVGKGLAVLLVVLVLGRQYATARENHDLARSLRRREAELHHLAFHDALTGLANRALFLDRLGHALDLAARRPRPVSVVFLDLDGFKAVNDSLGHATGDALLVGVAKRLRAALRATDTVARLGGDEFAVLVEQGDDATVVARALLDALQAPFTLQGRRVAVSASIGVAVAEPGPGAAQAAGLLHRADVAMYAVKTSGKADVQVHSSVVHGALPHRGDRTGGRPPLHRAFAAALEGGGIRVAFQPVVDPVHGRIGMLEVLARWTHEGVDIPPDVFIPICEQVGLSEVLTAVMLEQSCAQLATWSQALRHDRLRVSVNIGPAELGDGDLPARIDRLLARHRLAPSQLALEITESGVPSRPGVALDVLHGLRHIGVRLALDDFGTGYSTLARLSTTPLDTVKIDRAFVADIDHDQQQRRFLQGLLELTRHLGLSAVAEGVERTGQLVELRRLGCDLVQGHLVARPATVSELTPVVLAEQSLLPRGLVVDGAAEWTGNPVLTASGKG